MSLWKLAPELSSTYSCCLLTPNVAFEAYVPFSNVWKFALMVAQFPDLEISFFPVLFGLVQKKEKSLVTSISTQQLKVLDIFLPSSLEYFQPSVVFISTFSFSGGSYASIYVFYPFHPIPQGGLASLSC